MQEVGRRTEAQGRAIGQKTGGGFRDGFGQAVKGMGPVFQKALLPATVGFGLVVAGAHKAIQAASDLNEQMNKTGVVFKDAAPAMLEWSKTSATALGMSRRQALEAAGTFGNMLVPMGFARKEAAGMSQRMVRLASDMASFNNATPEQTLDAIRAGLAGETEPLRRFGVFLNEARIKQEALSLGLIKGADAAKAAQTAFVAADRAAASAKAAHVAAALQLSVAQDAVAEAQERSKGTAEALATAEKRHEAASDRVAAADKRQETATKNLRAAKLTLRDAQANSLAMQVALTDARKRATEQLEELRDAARDSALSEERASIGVERARQRLEEVTADAESTDLDKREAALSLREAERSLQEAQEKRTGVTADLADAEAKGVEGADAVVKARQDLAKADAEADKAARQVTATQRAYARAQTEVREAVESLNTAQDNLTAARARAQTATAGLEKAQARLDVAEEREEKTKTAQTAAEERLTKARKRATEANKAAHRALTSQEKAQAIYSLMQKDAADANHDFEETSDGVANQQRILAARTEDTAAAIGKDLIPAQQQMNELMLKFLKLTSKSPKTVMVLVGAFAALSGIIIAVNAAMKAYEIMVIIVKAVTKLWRNEQIKLNLAMLTNPIFLVIVALVALGAALFIAYKKVDWFHEAVDNAFHAVVDAAKWLLDFFKENWQYVLAGMIAGPFGLAVVAIIKHWDDIKDAVEGAVGAVLGFLNTALTSVTAAASNLGKAIKDGIVDGVTGVANAVWGIVDNIGALFARYASKVIGWGRDVGTWLKDAAVNAVVGIANAVWGVITNIGDRFAQGIETVKAWGRAVGGWLKDAAVGAVGGIAQAVWDVVKTIGDKFSTLMKTVKDWGEAVGGWIKSGIIAGLEGLGDLIRNLIRKAIRSVGGKLGKALSGAGGLIGKATGRQAYAPGAVVPQAVAPGLLGGSAEGGSLAGTPPPLYQLKRLMATAQPAPAAAPQFEVRVFIGDTELKGIVRAEVRQDNDAIARTLLAAGSGVA